MNPSSSTQGALIAAVTLLAGLGLVVIHSATAHFAAGDAIPPHFVRHGVALILGAGLAMAVARAPLGLWRSLALPLWGLGVALLAATLVVGVEVNGARRWLAVPGVGFRFQPGELAKLTTLLALAAWLSRPAAARPNSPKELCVPALLALVPAALLLAQPDFGNTVVLLLLMAGVLFVAGTSPRAFAVPCVVGAVAIGGYIATRSYALVRFTGFLDPWATANDQGFQLVQSFVAFGRGGLFGVGLGDGRQKLFYLPEAHTDFVLSLVAEDLGLLGVLVVAGLFAALLVAGIRIARSATNRFALFTAFSATALITIPAVLNSAVVMGLLPTKGLPLPLLSYGRTALTVSFLAVGLLLAVARQTERDTGFGRGSSNPRSPW